MSAGVLSVVWWVALSGGGCVPKFPVLIHREKATVESITGNMTSDAVRYRPGAGCAHAFYRLYTAVTGILTMTADQFYWTMVILLLKTS